MAEPTFTKPDYLGDIYGMGTLAVFCNKCGAIVGVPRDDETWKQVHIEYHARLDRIEAALGDQA